ncbi:MAG: tetratricopeptide repeat protein [Bacteroidota bacterium]
MRSFLIIWIVLVYAGDTLSQTVTKGISEEVAIVIDRSKALTFEDPMGALSSLDSLLSIADLNQREFTEVHFTKGRIYYLGLLEKDNAILSFYQSLRYSRHIDDTKRKNGILTFLGICYSNLAHYDYAQEYYAEALTLELDPKTRLITSYNLAQTLRYNEKYDSALSMQHQLEPEFKRQEMEKYLVWSQLESGANYVGKEDWSNALIRYGALKERAEETQDLNLMAKALHSLGTIHLGMEDFEEARDYFLKALPLKLAEGDQALLLTTYNNLGLLERLEGNHLQAREYWKQSADLDPRQVDIVMLVDNVKAVIEISEELGDTETAYDYSIRLNDIMVPMIETQERLEELHTQYVVEKIRTEIEAFELKESLTIAQLRIWLIASVLTLLIVISALIYWILKKRQRLDDSVIEHLKERDQLLYYISYRYHVDVPSMLREMRGEDNLAS